MVRGGGGRGSEGGGEGGGRGGLVVDAEMVAIDRPTGKLRAFQELSVRPRGAVSATDVTVDVCVFVFDIMCAGGEGTPVGAYPPSR